MLYEFFDAIILRGHLEPQFQGSEYKHIAPAILRSKTHAVMRITTA